jgi:hypothetical protein
MIGDRDKERDKWREKRDSRRDTIKFWESRINFHRVLSPRNFNGIQCNSEKNWKRN